MECRRGVAQIRVGIGRDTAYRKCRGRPKVSDLQSRHDVGQASRIGNAGALQIFPGDGRDRERRRLQVFGALLRRDDDFLKRERLLVVFMVVPAAMFAGTIVLVLRAMFVGVGLLGHHIRGGPHRKQHHRGEYAAAQSVDSEDRHSPYSRFFRHFLYAASSRCQRSMAGA